MWADQQTPPFSQIYLFQTDKQTNNCYQQYCWNDVIKIKIIIMKALGHTSVIYWKIIVTKNDSEW